MLVWLLRNWSNGKEKRFKEYSKCFGLLMSDTELYSFKVIKLKMRIAGTKRIWMQGKFFKILKTRSSWNASRQLSEQPNRDKKGNLQKE